MAVRRHGAATAAGLVVLSASLVACTPRADHVYVDNRTGHTVTLWAGPIEIGTAGPDGTTELDPPDGGCTWDPLRAVTGSGELAAVLPGPACGDRRLVLDEDDLAPATARATVVNDTGSEVDLSFLTGEQIVAAPGERVEVRLQLPAGACLVPPADVDDQDTAVPEFWGGDLCDGEVRTLLEPTDPTLTVDNRTGRDLTVVAATDVLGVVKAHSRAAVPLPSAACLTGQVRVLDSTRTQIAALPETVCPLESHTVEDLVRAARATVTNSTPWAIHVTLAGPALPDWPIVLLPGETRQVSLESAPGTCVLVEGAPGPDAWLGDDWTGYLCDNAALTAIPGTQGRFSWETSW